MKLLPIPKTIRFSVWLSVSLLILKTHGFGISRSSTSVSITRPVRVANLRNISYSVGISRCHNRGTSLSASNNNPESSRLSEDQDSIDNTNDYKPLSFKEKALQPIQLATTIWLLLLLPAGFFSPGPSSLCGARYLGVVPYQYLFLFGLGTLPRQWRFGRFSKKQSSQITTKELSSSTKSHPGTTTRAFLLYQLLLFFCHWVSIYDYFRSLSLVGSRVPTTTTILSPTHVLSHRFYLTMVLIRWFAILLNANSAWLLGRAYDRVKAPATLITTGPYAMVRHPIYTSYLLLFASTMLSPLGSTRAFVLFLFGSICFYSARINSEEEILLSAFPKEWEEYKQRVPRKLLPWIY